MLHYADPDLKNAIMGLIKAVERIDSNFKDLKENRIKGLIEKEEFEGRKANMAEEIRKVRFEINQLKDKISVRNERELLIFEQLNTLSERFQMEIDEDTGIATIFLSVSLDTHFEIELDCSNYPELPFIFIPKELDDFFDGRIVTELKTLQKWSSKKPTQLVEILEELEEKLVEVYLRDDDIIEDREKIANRRKLIAAARNAENDGEFDAALIIYRDVLKISQELKDKKTYLKYKKKMQEVAAHSRQR